MKRKICLPLPAFFMMTMLLGSLPIHNAYSANPLPAIGTDDENPPAYDQTVQIAGRALTWDLRYIDDTYSSISPEGMNGLAEPQRHLRDLVVTVQIQSNLAGIIAGARDSKLQKIAQQMAAWQRVHPNVTLIVRPFHEMNGDWYPWGFGKGHNGNTASQFIMAWKHVRSVMRAEFPTLPFMWCPNILWGKNDNYAGYYPGNDQVEYIGLDGYNFSSLYGGWTPIGKVFESSLASIRAIPGMRPKSIVIAETGTTEPNDQAAHNGHSKAEWFTDMGKWLHTVAPKENIVAVLYFNYNNSSKKHKPCDYLIYDSSLPNADASRDAFRKAVADLP